MGKFFDNCLTRLAVNIKARDHLRRVGTCKTIASANGDANGTANGHAAWPDIMDGEQEPLLGARASLPPEAGFWRHLLLNRTSSPGTDSPNPFVRLPALVWNVTKVTLLSCACPAWPTAVPDCSIRNMFVCADRISQRGLISSSFSSPWASLQASWNGALPGYFR